MIKRKPKALSKKAMKMKDESYDGFAEMKIKMVMKVKNCSREKAIEEIENRERENTHYEVIDAEYLLDKMLNQKVAGPNEDDLMSAEEFFMDS